MARIHDNIPVLKTLFTIKAPKPGTAGWQTDLARYIVDTHTVKVLLHDRNMLADFARILPEYVIKVHESPNFGYIEFKDVKEENVLENPAFQGVSLMLELDPKFPLRDMLEGICDVFSSIAETYFDKWGLTEVDPTYFWLGGGVQQLLPIMQRSK